MQPLLTGLAAGLTTGLVVAAGSPTYAASDRAPGRDLFLSFDRLDDAGRPLLDALGGSVVGAVSSARGGEVTAGPDPSSSGHALRMERFRPEQPASPAVVVVRPVAGVPDPTDPGDDDFAFGASFALDRSTGVSPTDNGDNLVQRGLSGPNAQYKIELDGGHPRCRISGSEGAVAVRASQRVEAEEWYRVRCRRIGDEVTLRVVTLADPGREVRRYTTTGRTGSLSFDGAAFPFSVGGKVDRDGDVVAGDSDQFNGLVDDVVVRHLD